MPQLRPDQQAAGLLAKHHIVAAPIPVEKIAIAEGIAVVRSAAEWNQSGFLLRSGQSAMIGVNSKTSPRRQRFTIAHELGHWCMHEGELIVDRAVMINNRNKVSSQAIDPQEIEANRFAASLLMPRELVLDAASRQYFAGIANRDDFIASLSREFDVSIEAMGYRLINLGVLSS